jgi:hypothetical protein
MLKFAQVTSMEILNDRVLSLDSYIFLCSFYENKNSRSSISYNEFKKNLETFAHEVMTAYLIDTPFKNITGYCIVTKHDCAGTFLDKDNINLIIINEDIVKEMYKGNIWAITTLFHELNHFKVKYDLKLGYINIDLVRILKERLISTSSTYPSFIKSCHYDNPENNYYNNNYKYFSEENYADMVCFENFLYMIKNSKLNISKEQAYGMYKLMEKKEINYNFHIRDVSDNLNFNSYEVDFEEAFDLLVKDNPDWLEHPQLQIEYYLDKDRKVKKRTAEQLQAILENEQNNEIKDYINYLLKPKKTETRILPKRKPVLDAKLDTKKISSSNSLKK